MLSVGFAAVARSPLAVALLPTLGAAAAGMSAYIVHRLRTRKAVR
jgi:hypothetical protein